MSKSYILSICLVAVLIPCFAGFVQAELVPTGYFITFAGPVGTDHYYEYTTDGVHAWNTIASEKLMVANESLVLNDMYGNPGITFAVTSPFTAATVAVDGRVANDARNYGADYPDLWWFDPDSFEQRAILQSSNNTTQGGWTLSGFDPAQHIVTVQWVNTRWTTDERRKVDVTINGEFSNVIEDKAVSSEGFNSAFNHTEYMEWRLTGEESYEVHVDLSAGTNVWGAGIANAIYIEVAVIPEPGSFFLLGSLSAAAGLLGFGRRR